MTCTYEYICKCTSENHKLCPNWSEPLVPVPRPLVIIESPFAGNQDVNLVYLRRCLRDSWDKGEIPFGSHAFFPFFLRESDPEERKAGIEAGYRFWDQAEKIIFYLDYGLSPGMNKALDRAIHLGRSHLIERRSIGVN